MSNRKLLIEQNKHKDLTLVTVGCSFAWGDELGTSDSQTDVDDVDYRENHVFGKLLSDRLDANWTQLAMPGGNNQWMIWQLDQLLSNVSTDAVAVLTLSELGRELHGIDLPNYNPTNEVFVSSIRQGRSIKETLEQVELNYWHQLDCIQEKYPRVKILAGYGFTYPLTESKYLLDKTWVELLVNTNPVRAPLFFSGSYQLSERLLKHEAGFTDQLREEFIALCDLAVEQRQYMQDSGYYKTRLHPNEQGHCIWANYLYDEITKRQHG